MRCDEARRWLDLHLGDELPEEQQQQIERHLLRCAHCAGELRALEQTRALLREAVPNAEASPAYRERTVARLQGELAAYLRPVSDSDAGRQWSLPFPRQES